MWRLATERDDEVLVDLCRALYAEDPGPLAVAAPSMRETLSTLRREPWRGRAAVREAGGRVVGYALLIAYWSNELGGEVCAVDELYVARALRGQGHATALFEALERGELGAAAAVAVALGTTPDNARARRLYERLGLIEVGVSMVKRLPRPPA